MPLCSLERAQLVARAARAFAPGPGGNVTVWLCPGVYELAAGPLTLVGPADSNTTWAARAGVGVCHFPAQFPPF